jgi:cytochrome c biogenesis protein CcmG, thiol:disulfide interchange protein DsbE
MRSFLHGALVPCCAAIALGCGGASSDSAGAASPQGGLLGKPAPDFAAAAVANGRGKVALGAMRGKVVLVDFWGTFCEPCKKSFPRLQDLYVKYQGSGLQVIGISEDEADDKSKIPDFASTYGAKFTLAWDSDKSIAEHYKPETMPSSFLVDKNGVVRYVHVGYHDGEERQIDKEIRDLLGL